ncbi:MAG: hypothetical protein OEY29_09145 [Gammaproteobacteria bacterium]|nr:hypothetical protein [Gammaproteobacteria bacterium]
MKKIYLKKMFYGMLGLRSVVLVVVLLTVSSMVQANNAMLSASFDWNMPERLFDTNSDGIPEYDPLMEVEPVDGWQINLDACLSTGDNNIVSYSWKLDDVDVTSSANCSGVITVPNLGVHTLKLTIEDSVGTIATVQKDIEVKNILLVGLGDSFASGEGNPDVPAVIPAAADVVTDVMTNIYESDAIQQNIADYNNLKTTAQQTYNTAITNYNNVLGYSEAIIYNGPLYVSWWLLVEPACLEVLGIPLTPNDCNTATNNRDYYYHKTRYGIIGLGISYSNMHNDMSAIIDAANTATFNALATRDAAQAELDNLTAMIINSENHLAINTAAIADTLTALGAYPGEWMDQQCHRSAISGQAQAALKLEQADTKSSVTFVHLACSGATILSGLTSTQAKGTDQVTSQIDQLANRIGARTIDSLLVSIGGNDVGFSTVLQSCVDSEPCLTLCSDGLTLCPSTGLDIFNTGVSKLQADATTNGSFASLQAKFTEVLGSQLDASNVYFTSYPDMLQDDDGTTCRQDPNDTWSTMPNFSNSEMAAARVLSTQLNTEVGTLTVSNGWNFIDTLPDAMANHGYCANDHWIVRMYETFEVQGDQSGMVHPNLKGHQAYANEISNRIIPVLIPVQNENPVTSYQAAADNSAAAMGPLFALIMAMFAGLGFRGRVSYSKEKSDN